MTHSNDLLARAQVHIPGGVNSPVRNFKAVELSPPFIREGHGATIIDEDNNSYIDYVCCWGADILGHAAEPIVQAVKQQMDKGLGFGAPTALEVAMAELVCDMVPSMDKVRMVNSGTEATMSALRLARGATGRDKIIKFEGCYHGHADALLVKAGSGALTFGCPSSPGVPADFTKHTLVADFNDLDSVETHFKQYPKEIAAIIVEPIAGNMNMVPATETFLQGLRNLCTEYGALLILDEVMTGFRVGRESAQGLYGVTPDLTCLGKVIGGGLPVGAFGGRADIMAHLAPEGAVYQAGTLSGNPIAMAAGFAALTDIKQNASLYYDLNSYTEQLTEGLKSLAHSHGIALATCQRGGMFGFFFTQEEQVSNFAQVMACDKAAFVRFFQGMLAEGVYLAPSAFEAGFVSLAHTHVELDKTLRAADKVFSMMTN